MNSFRADLHCHSTCSDGTFTPEELVRHALDKGLQGLSITDHDNVSAYALAKPLADRLGLALISGVEFSAELRGVSVHVLGYAFQTDHPAILDLCTKHKNRRAQRNHEMFEKLAQLDMPLDEEALSLNAQTLGRPHIAQAMVDKGYVDSIPDAFKKFLAEGRPAYVRGELFSVEETLNTLHQAGGVAIIAHPHLIDRPRILNQLVEMPFDGIECFYSRFDKSRNQRWIRIAEKKGWLMTGGSDFHGMVKPGVELGCSWVGIETFQQLKDRQQHAVP